MRLEPLYRVRFSYSDGWGADLAGPENDECQFFFLAEGRCEGRIAGHFVGANHPHRRSDGTFLPDFQGVHRDRRRGGGPIRLQRLRPSLSSRQAAGGRERHSPERGRPLPLAQRLSERRGWGGALTTRWADGAGHRVGRGGVGADRGMIRLRETREDVRVKPCSRD
jgi:hypothetical protein